MRRASRLQTIVEEAVDEALDRLPKPRRRDAGLVREAVRRAVRGEIDTAWGKKPPTIIHVDACERLSRCSAG